jgi:UDP-3-O-[3-hydroxymyristoyl] glucosamine N-acyltransferase
MIKLQEIIDALNPNSTHLNNIEVEIKDVIKSNTDNAFDNVIYWVSSSQNETLPQYKFGTILCNELPLNYNNTKCNYLLFDNPRLAFKKLLDSFFKKEKYSLISESARIDPLVELSSKLYIGEYVIIEQNCSIGSNVFIGHNTTILANTKIGDNVTIGCNNTIGGTGFGYEKNQAGELQPIEHIGGVTIHDNVEIGNNSCIDKAVLGFTIIGKGTKVDNLVHIAHGVEIGANCAIIAHAIIGGSTIIGDNTWVSPNATLRDRITIGKNVLVGMGAVVTKNIPDNEVWMGNPAKKYL